MADSSNRSSKQHWEFVARKPRHDAGTIGGLDLRVEVDEQISARADLLDCSRHGMRLQASESLPSSVDVILHFSAPSEYINWSTKATIRWCRANATGWECGCQFHEELAWEHLGQLLLAGYLSQD